MSNPISQNIFNNNYTPTGTLTRQHVTNTTLQALATVAIIALITYGIGTQFPVTASLANLIGAGGLVAVSFVAMFNKHLNPATKTWMYSIATLEGLMAGGFSYTVANYMVQGTPAGVLIGQALLATVIITTIAVIAYVKGWVRFSERVRSFIRVAGLGFLFLYSINFIVALFGFNFLFAQDPIPIIIGVVAIILATMSIMNTLQDSDELIAQQAPEEVKYGIATDLMADVVWMYVEILRVLALSNRD